MLLWSVKEKWIGLYDRPLAKQVDEQDDRVAVSTVASQAQRAPIQVMLGAAALAKEPLATAWTFVHCVGHQQPLALELLVEDSRIQIGLRLVTQPVGELLAGWLQYMERLPGGLPPHTGQVRVTAVGLAEG